MTATWCDFRADQRVWCTLSHQWGTVRPHSLARDAGHPDAVAVQFDGSDRVVAVDPALLSATEPADEIPAWLRDILTDARSTVDVANTLGAAAGALTVGEITPDDMRRFARQIRDDPESAR